MNNYSKFLNKNENKVKKFFIKLFSKILVCIMLFLSGLIVVKIDKNNGSKIYKYLYNNNISFAKINELYDKYLGGVLPFKKNSSVKEVFSETLKYKNINIYEDGVSLEVEDNYLVPSLDKGVVVYIGDKDSYGNTVVVQQIDGVYVWYGNMDSIDVSLYDYVKKGELLGEVSKKLYLVFQDGEEFLDYKKYLK